MLLHNHEVDLGKSFEKLKESLKVAVKKTKGNNPGRYADAFGYLESSVKKHIIDCTDDVDLKELQEYISGNNQDDLKNINI